MKWFFQLDSVELGPLDIDEPIGWDDAELTLKRDDEWHGIFFEYSLPLKFVNDGFFYLQDMYNLKGIEAIVDLSIRFLCEDNDDFEELGTFRLNFTKISFTKGNICEAKIPVDPSGCLMTFKNRYDQKVNVKSLETLEGTPLTPYTNIGITIPLPQRKIIKYHSSENTIDNEALKENFDTFTLGPSSYTKTSYFSLVPNNQLINEIENFNGIGVNPYDGDVNTVDGVEPFLILKENGTYNFDISLNIGLTYQAWSIFGGGSPANLNAASCVTSLELSIYRDGVQIFFDNLYTNSFTPTPAGGAPVLYPLDADFLTSTFFINLIEGDKIYLRLAMTSNFTGLVLNNVEYYVNHFASLKDSASFSLKSFLKIDFESSYKETSSEVSMINETLSRTVEIITNDCLRVYSDHYGRTDAQPYDSTIDGCASLRALTTGLFIRNMPNANNYILSFKDLFEALNSIDCIGIGIEDDPNRVDEQLLRVEPVEYFYNTDTILTLDGIAEVVIEPWLEKFISVFKNGYTKWEAEEFTGLDEFNTKREWRTKQVVVKNTITQLCQFIAAGYTLEITRRKNATLGESKDWRYDNDIFILCLKRAIYSLEVEVGNIIDDANILDAANAINFRISPLRNMLNWAKLIIQCYKDPLNVNSTISFQNGDGNLIATGYIDDDCSDEFEALVENQDVNYTSLSVGDKFTPPFLSERIKFDFPLSASQWRTLITNPNKSLSIRYGNEEDFINCFIYEIKYRPNDGLATYDLIMQKQLEGIGEMEIEGTLIPFEVT